MQASGFINAFTAGELGPDAQERSDLVQHAKGMAPGTNLIVSAVGPAMSRGGSWDRGAAIDQTKRGRLVRFVRSRLDALLLEFGDYTFRVRTPEGVVTADVVTPFGEDALPGLWFKQIGDVLYVTHQQGRVPHVFERFANDTWVVKALELRDGPWLGENIDRDFTLACSAIAGTVNVVASKDLFTEAHVGACFRLRAQSTGASMGAWSSAFDVLIDYEMCVSDGKVYRTTTAADDNKTGTNPPVHDHGVANDGGMNWEYLHEGSGIIRITEVVDEQNAVAEVVGGMLPTQGTEQTHDGADGFRRVLSPSDQASIDFPATSYWSEQAFSEAQGWPTALIEQMGERLVMVAPNSKPSTAWLTRTAGFGPDYTDFKPGRGTGAVVADDAVRLTVGEAGAPILWLARVNFLVAGTTDGEFVITGGNINDPITPDSNGSRPISAYGSAAIAPLILQGPPLSLMMVARAGDTIRELRIAPDLTTEAADITLLVDHLRARGFSELAWQHPDEIMWARLADGGLAAFTYHQEQQVRAWTTQELGGGYEVESIAAIPSLEVGGDVLFALVKRGEGPTLQRRLWRFARRSENMWMDGAKLYQGDAVSTVTGLDFLEGDTVQIVGTAVYGEAVARHPDKVVTGGAVALKTPCEGAIVGLPYTARFVTLPLDLQGVGSTLRRRQELNHLSVVVDCVTAMVGDGVDNGQGMSPVLERPPNWLNAPLAHRIIRRVGIGAGGGRGRDRRIVIEEVGPFDLVVRSIRIEEDVKP